MVSQFPHLFGARGHSLSRAEQTTQTEGIVKRVLDRVGEAFCGLHGHDSLLQFQPDRLFLKCVSCGHESPGWKLYEMPPGVAVHAHVGRRTESRTQLVSDRRIA